MAVRCKTWRFNKLGEINTLKDSSEKKKKEHLIINP